MICGGELVFCFQITTVQNELTTRPVSRLAIDLNSPAKINLTCRIQLIAKPPHICRIQSIAEFNSTQRKCGVLFTSSVIRMNVKEQTKSVLLREFLPSLKGQHRWQKRAIKHYRNVPAFSSFSRHEVLYSGKENSFGKWQNTLLYLKVSLYNLTFFTIGASSYADLIMFQMFGNRFCSSKIFCR